MNIIKHYRNNKKEKMTFLKNIGELFFHLHNGRKRAIICILAIGLNYYAISNLSLSTGQWIFVLSIEYLALELAKAFTSEVTL